MTLFRYYAKNEKGENIMKAFKRLGRVFVAATAGAGMAVILKEMSGQIWYPAVAPIVTAGVAALGKFIRETWDIRVPF